MSIFLSQVYLTQQAEDTQTLAVKSVGAVTTMDPISEIMANVEILDVNDYIPKGYSFVDEEFEVNEDIESLTKEEVLQKFKPGKLYGKKLAAMTEKLKLSKNVKLMEGGSRKGLPSLELSESSAILSGEIIKSKHLDHKKESGELLSTLSSSTSTLLYVELMSSTTPTSTTTTSTSRRTSPIPISTTPGVCGEYCSLAGTIFITSGLDWSEELLQTYSDKYEEVTGEVVKEIAKIFENVYFGSTFEFASVEAYSRRDGKVLVDFYLQFGGIIFNVNTKDIKESFAEKLEVGDSNNLKMGKFDIDLSATYFLVVDTSSPLKVLEFETVDGTLLPDWAWLVVFVGVVSTFIITFFAVIMGVNKIRHDKVLKSKVLNPKTLQQFRGQKHFAEVDVDVVTAYATDKRDIWTIQKTQQKKEIRKSQASLGHHDSKMGSINSNRAKGIYERFPSLGKAAGKRQASLNDSSAELLGGNDSTCLDESRDFIDNDAVDTRVEVGQYYGNLSRSDLVHSLGDQVLADYGSDRSAVSDGPSEKI